MQSSHRESRLHLPLRPSAFAVLAALAERPLPGIDILDAVNATVPGTPLLGPGTLYRLLRELRQQQLITRVDTAAADERQAHHELTPAGRATLRAEAARLRRTLDLADGRSRTGPR
ncbi:MAG TPA: helix-turn-helix transcriptional regulator [Vicinamibacterales bacterium]|jgi:DNA-binding PadR family transcriptional regulator|nr:helix-turn-helix transcriptional regulator [Vicinamibacterales bacterium]